MTSLAPSIDGGGIGPLVTPADLASSVAAGNNSASLQSQDSYTVTIDNLPVSLFRKYAFTFSYIYSDPSGPIDGPRSATYFVEYTPPNECTEPTNVTVTQGIGSYGIKWDKPTFGTYVDTIIYESPNGSFDSTSKVVYIGTANQCTVLTGTDYSQRFIKVYYRDKYLHQSPSGTVAGPISGKNSDPDTSTAPSAPQLGLPVPFLDADDKSGFSAGVTINWSPNSGTNTAGYVIRWSTQNPAVITNPLWEYGQVEGQSSSSFTVKGLIPNTLYYYQVTSKSPYNAISWTSPQSGTFGPVVDPAAPSDVWAQLKSILSIGGKTADLFKIGTGITQSINNSITTTPTMTASLPWSGIILNKSTTDQGNNYWLNTGQFRVGSSSSFLYWDGSNLYTTGRINATGGSFSGDIQLSTGSLYTGSTPNSGARVRFNSGGIYAYDSTSTNSSTGNTFTLDAATGLISAQKGSISGWTIDGTKFSQNGAVIDSAGKISLGTTANASVYLSATDPTYRIWVGNNNGANASFSVDSSGVMRATGAIISGTLSVGTTLSSGTSLSTLESNVSTALSTANSASSVAGSATTTANNAFTKANAALPSSSFNRAAIVQYINSTTSNPTNTTSIDGGTIITGTVSANAVVADFISAFSINADKITSGTITGRDISGGTIKIGTPGSSSYFEMGSYSRSGIPALGINAIAMESVTTSGVISSWYPYGESNQDLGILAQSGVIAQRWRNLRLRGYAAFGGAGNSDTTADGVKIIINSDGTIYANTLGVAGGTGTNIVQYGGYLKVASSSRRYKENIISIINSGYIEAINKLNPVNYNFKESVTGTAPILNSGFIAEEINEIPELRTIVAYNEKGEPESVAYDKLTVFLTLAVQELSNMVKSLQQEVSDLKGK